MKKQVLLKELRSMTPVNDDAVSNPYSPEDVIFEIVVPGSDKLRLAQFSEGTEDPNPIHVDENFAKKAGFPTILQQGPMTTAHFARLLSEKVGQDNLSWLDVSFTGPVFPGEPLTLKAWVTSVETGLVNCALSAAKSDGTITAKAVAEFAV
ncbi:MAG: MaoC family dehydratase [Fimbriimonadaceae bacterium]|nr:MaoC family dehydratase [Alphaproteobacteria bacterium]